jgi:hypothetical protein
MSDLFVRRFIVACAAGLALLGFPMLFGGEEIGGRLLGISTPGPVGSWLGGALLGFAAMNWLARALPQGGIYSRAVVSANQIHFVVGALTLLKHGMTHGAQPLLWAITGFYALGALFFTLLLWRRPQGGK